MCFFLSFFQRGPPEGQFFDLDGPGHSQPVYPYLEYPLMFNAYNTRGTGLRPPAALRRLVRSRANYQIAIEKPATQRPGSTQRRTPIKAPKYINFYLTEKITPGFGKPSITMYSRPTRPPAHYLNGLMDQSELWTSPYANRHPIFSIDDFDAPTTDLFIYPVEEFSQRQLF